MTLTAAITNGLLVALRAGFHAALYALGSVVLRGVWAALVRGGLRAC